MILGTYSLLFLTFPIFILVSLSLILSPTFFPFPYQSYLNVSLLLSSPILIIFLFLSVIISSPFISYYLFFTPYTSYPPIPILRWSASPTHPSPRPNLTRPESYPSISCSFPQYSQLLRLHNSGTRKKVNCWRRAARYLADLHRGQPLPQSVSRLVRSVWGSVELSVRRAVGGCQLCSQFVGYSVIQLVSRLIIHSFRQSVG